MPGTADEFLGANRSEVLPCVREGTPPVPQYVLSFRYVDRVAGTLLDASDTPWHWGEVIGQLRHMPCAGHRCPCRVMSLMASAASCVQLPRRLTHHHTVCRWQANGTPYGCGERLLHDW